MKPDPASSKAPWRIYNIGNSKPIALMDFIAAIEDALGIEAKKNFLPMQAGDVVATSADVQTLMDDVGFKPDTPLKNGVKQFIDWYREYYKV